MVRVARFLVFQRPPTISRDLASKQTVLFHLCLHADFCNHYKKKTDLSLQLFVRGGTKLATTPLTASSYPLPSGATCPVNVYSMLNRPSKARATTE